MDPLTSPRRSVDETGNKDIKLIDFGINESNPIPVSRSQTLLEIDPSDTVFNPEYTEIGFLPLPKIEDKSI